MLYTVYLLQCIEIDLRYGLEEVNALKWDHAAAKVEKSIGLYWKNH